MPQSRTVFAVSLQEHPELLNAILPLCRQEVKDYSVQTAFYFFSSGAPGTTFVVLGFSEACLAGKSARSNVDALQLPCIMSTGWMPAPVRRSYFFVLFGFLTSFFAPCRDCAMFHHLLAFRESRRERIPRSLLQGAPIAAESSAGIAPEKRQEHRAPSL